MPQLEGITERIEHLLSGSRIADFAHRWKIAELALFGSVLRDDFDDDSDIDVLVSFDPAATWSLWDLTAMQDELASIMGRKVDLVEKEGIRNPFRRQSILSGRKVIHVAP
jgi:predicted nucleotidyltransferase